MTSEAQTSEAQTSEAQTSDAQTSDAQTSDAQTSATQTSEAQTSDAQTSAAQTSIILAIHFGVVVCILRQTKDLLASLRIICVRCNAMTQIISKCATLFSVSLTSSTERTSAVS